MIRVVLAAIIGGFLMFVWTVASHTVLSFQRDALKPIPNEAVVLSTLSGNITTPGMYAFPWIDMGANPAPAEQHEWAQKLASGPSGLLIYRPDGGESMSPRQLVSAFVSDVLAAFLGALILFQLPGGFVRRVLSITLIGVAAWLSISVSQWTWYGFSTPFLLGDLVDQSGRWLLAGIGMATLIKPRRVRSF